MNARYFYVERQNTIKLNAFKKFLNQNNMALFPSGIGIYNTTQDKGFLSKWKLSLRQITCQLINSMLEPSIKYFCPYLLLSIGMT